MNTRKTFSLLAAAIIVAGQATLFAVDTHATAQGQAAESHQNRYEAKASEALAAYATTQNASTIRGA